MSLSSFFRKNKQKSDVGNSDSAAFQLSADADSQTAESQTVKARKRRPTGQAGQDSARTMPVDPVLPEKKRARRRLVGAVALVLAAVIGLPMVLDSEPKPLPADLSIEIPSQSSGSAKTRAPVARMPEQAALDQKEQIVEMPANDNKVATPEAASGIGADPESDGRQTRFMLQVGAFASQEKVNELRGKLKAAGIMSHTQKISTDSGERVRIRIGPFNSRPDADKMRVRLVGMGLSGTISPVSSP
ncbi:MAG: SPOR domain-containing protein [Pseudomonadota bacterium]